MKFWRAEEGATTPEKRNLIRSCSPENLKKEEMEKHVQEIQANLLSDYFEEEQGSKVWPSSDLQDSPDNKFICKLCGWSFKTRIYGDFPLGYDPYKAVEKTQKQHLSVAHQIALYGDW